MQHSGLVALAMIILGVGGALVAQEEHPAQHQHSPYAGHETSEIPSLTPDELEQLRNGEGMGFAKAAELNHYPGPRHVLDLATELELTAAQRTRTEKIFDEMQQRAHELGEQIIEAERHLNTRFSNHHIDETALGEATTAIAELYERLRFTHLSAHLQVSEVLEPAQIERYDQLRGYQAPKPPYSVYNTRDGSARAATRAGR